MCSSNSSFGIEEKRRKQYKDLTLSLSLSLFSLSLSLSLLQQAAIDRARQNVTRDRAWVGGATSPHRAPNLDSDESAARAVLVNDLNSERQRYCIILIL